MSSLIREFFKDLLFPYENKWKNIALYAIPTAIFLYVIYDNYRAYNIELARYNSSEITDKPEISDYFFLNRWEKNLREKAKENTIDKLDNL